MTIQYFLVPHCNTTKCGYFLKVLYLLSNICYYKWPTFLILIEVLQIRHNVVLYFKSQNISDAKVYALFQFCNTLTQHIDVNDYFNGRVTNCIKKEERHTTTTVDSCGVVARCIKHLMDFTGLSLPIWFWAPRLGFHLRCFMHLDFSTLRHHLFSSL